MSIWGGAEDRLHVSGQFILLSSQFTKAVVHDFGGDDPIFKGPDEVRDLRLDGLEAIADARSPSAPAPERRRSSLFTFRVRLGVFTRLESRV